MSHVLRSTTLVTTLLLAGCASPAELETSAPPTTEAAARSATLDDLVGTWDVALYFSPDAPPSATVMEITAVEEGALVGTFYGSAFETGRATLHRNEVILFAVTSDGTGPYGHAARLRGDGSLEGQTLSTGRDFLMAWKASRRPGAAGDDG